MRRQKSIPGVMLVKAGTHATLRTVNESGVDPRLRGDDVGSARYEPGHSETYDDNPPASVGTSRAAKP